MALPRSTVGERSYTVSWSAGALQLTLWCALFVLCLAILVRQVDSAFDVEQSMSALDTAGRRGVRAGVESLGLSLQTFVVYGAIVDLSAKAAAACVSALLISRARGDWFISLLAYIILANTAANYPPDIPRAMDHDPVWVFLARCTTLLAISIFFVVPFLFPNGRFVPRWAVAPTTLAVVLGATFIWDFPLGVLSQPSGTAIEIVTSVFIFGSALGGQVYRYRRVATEKERQQTKWVVIGIVIALPAFVIGDAFIRSDWDATYGAIAVLAFPIVISFAFLAIPVTIAVAIVRHRLYDVDVVISRTLVWGISSALVVACYVAIVLGLGSLLHVPGSLPLSILATGIVAVGFQPVRSAVQRRVNRALFGDRDDPYAVLSRLGNRMASTLRPDELLPSIVHALTDALRVPYAAIYLRSPGGLQLAAANGSTRHDVTRFPLIHQSEQIGELHVAPRNAGEPFGRNDLRVLDELANQIGVAAHAVRLTVDLQRSRERIVIAREEERQRLRRDLHDGLGTHLAALAVKATVLRGQIAREPAQAEETAVELRAELKLAIADIRQLVHGLRPPALDELGLEGALQTVVERFRGASSEVVFPSIELRMGVLPQLPAAVEVAVYRIVEEAITNALKHAHAENCIVSVTMKSDVLLELSIVDDGRGVAPARPSPGFGLVSMRERAEELGGQFELTSQPGARGTRIDVVLPVDTTWATA